MWLLRLHAEKEREREREVTSKDVQMTLWTFLLSWIISCI